MYNFSTGDYYCYNHTCFPDRKSILISDSDYYFCAFIFPSTNNNDNYDNFCIGFSVCKYMERKKAHPKAGLIVNNTFPFTTGYVKYFSTSSANTSRDRCGLHHIRRFLLVRANPLINTVLHLSNPLSESFKCSLRYLHNICQRLFSQVRKRIHPFGRLPMEIS